MSVGDELRSVSITDRSVPRKHNGKREEEFKEKSEEYESKTKE